MPDLSPKSPSYGKPKKNGEQRKVVKYSRPSADLSALIDVIREEGHAYRKEEQLEDSGKKVREWITIGLIALTLIAVGWQVYEMVKVYEPIKAQAEASQRAAEAATKQSENSD